MISGSYNNVLRVNICLYYYLCAKISIISDFSKYLLKIIIILASRVFMFLRSAFDSKANEMPRHRDSIMGD